ncbi:MAG TPA: EamA family transporter [Candidatus Saccharimonadales bacterium]|nr:EamA family transporter [Candidatus Saccharimonadales bacterium]
MSATLIATTAGLATAIAWGSADYLGARSTRKLKPVQITLVTDIISITIALVLFLIFGFHHLTLNQVVQIVVYDICLNVAYLTFLQALSKGAVGIVVPLGNIYAFFTLLLALAFHQAHFSTAEFTGMLVIIFGAVVLAYEKNHRKLPLRELHHKTILALAASLIWGVGFFILNSVVSQVPWQTITITGEMTSVVLTCMLFSVLCRGSIVASAKAALKTKVAYLNGVVGQAGMLAFYFGSHEARNVVIPTVLSTCGPLVASFWGRVLDAEKIGWLKRAGAVAVVAGIVILNLN